VECGHVAQRQPIGSSPYTLACTAKSASGAAGGFIGRQPVTLIFAPNLLQNTQNGNQAHQAIGLPGPSGKLLDRARARLGSEIHWESPSPSRRSKIWAKKISLLALQRKNRAGEDLVASARPDSGTYLAPVRPKNGFRKASCRKRKRVASMAISAGDIDEHQVEVIEVVQWN
jgi:hypothetical protein